MYHAAFTDRLSGHAPDLQLQPVVRFISPPKPLIPRKRSILVIFRPHQGAECRYSRNPIANRHDH